MENVYRQIIVNEIPKFYFHVHKPTPFAPDKSSVPVSGRVYGPEEMESLVDSALDFWLTTGRFNDAFEKRFAEYLGVKHVLTTNSGSSANLLAVSALTSPKLGEKRLKPGDEVITVAAGFPTTVNPVIQNGLIPVFVDVDIPTYNIKPELIEDAVNDKTRAIMLAHTLGNPFNVNEV
ncbi:DegT/DnrJ/EryC1/StrS family aminotransferase, partial [bacterium]|nr:DegT/DnrJ/EryC1/StrS family aminotransferase [bacterium]